MQTAHDELSAKAAHEWGQAWAQRVEDGEDDAPLTEVEALEQAAELIEANPYSIAWWLNNDASIKSDGPADVPSASRRFQAGDELTDGELLALIWRAGDDCRAAAAKLKERYLSHRTTLAAIKEMASELMAD